MMMNFTVDCVRGHKDGVLLLITADAGGRLWMHRHCCVRVYKGVSRGRISSLRQVRVGLYIVL